MNDATVKISRESGAGVLAVIRETNKIASAVAVQLARVGATAVSQNLSGTEHAP